MDMNLDGENVADALAEGKLVVAIMSKGHFTKSGHFIVPRGNHCGWKGTGGGSCQSEAEQSGVGVVPHFGGSEKAGRSRRSILGYFKLKRRREEMILYLSSQQRHQSAGLSGKERGCHAG